MPQLTAAGLQKTSLIDFPGRVSCVVFLTGCNFTCPYCHNPQLARGEYPVRIAMAELTAFIKGRRDFLDGVVITGGEPCLWADLPQLCRTLRNLGLAVKLDTNGSRPEILKALIHAGLVDYIAMDLKTAPDNYGPPLCPEDTGEAILQSIHTIMTGGVDYEFRTTCVPPFVDAPLIQRMARAIKGAQRYILQNCSSCAMLAPEYFGTAATALSMEQMIALQRLAAPLVADCAIR